VALYRCYICLCLGVRIFRFPYFLPTLSVPWRHVVESQLTDNIDADDSAKHRDSVADVRARRRSGIFGTSGGARSSFRRAPASAAAAADDSADSQSATLPRRRRRNDASAERSDSPAPPSRLSSRAASWASLRRSQTSESLSLLRTQVLLMSNGFSLVTASHIVSAQLLCFDVSQTSYTRYTCTSVKTYI